MDREDPDDENKAPDRPAGSMQSFSRVRWRIIHEETLVAIAIMGMGIPVPQALRTWLSSSAASPRSPGRSRTSARTMKTAPVWLWKTQTPGHHDRWQEGQVRVMARTTRPTRAPAPRLLNASSMRTSRVSSATSIPAPRFPHRASTTRPASHDFAVSHQSQADPAGLQGGLPHHRERRAAGLGGRQLCRQTLGGKKIAIIDDRTAYGQGLADETEKPPRPPVLQIVAREFTTDKATDFMAILTKIKATPTPT